MLILNEKARKKPNQKKSNINNKIIKKIKKIIKKIKKMIKKINKLSENIKDKNYLKYCLFITITY